MLKLSSGVAFLGGIFMVVAMFVVVASVTGGLFGYPILGETEIVSTCIVISVFCFLPYCHMLGRNIKVEFLSEPLPLIVRDALDVLMNLSFAFITAVLTWRLMAGGLAALERQKVSMFLQIPDWIAYLACSIGGILWVTVAIFVTWEAILRMVGKLPRPDRNASPDIV